MPNDLRPNVQFFRLIDQARPPQIADRSGMGTLPTRAYRYCEAVTSATAYGWWVFSPMDFYVFYNGDDIFWRYEGSDVWLKLMPSAQFPNFAAQFDAAAPPNVRGFSPPFLTALPEAGTLQIWSGLIARTAPGWDLLLRAPANLPLPGGFTLYEGIVATDRWFGPLFANLRLTKTDHPIRIRSDFPLLQIQPLRLENYGPDVMKSMSVIDAFTDMTIEDWEAYRSTIVEPNKDQDRPHGGYATNIRRAQKCPVADHRQ